MGLTSFVSSKPYKNFMSKLYGWGASIVIIGALFKIVHLEYANELLFVGLITEAVIFFFSAFEPPHVEPNWSLVYPELAGMYHADKPGAAKKPASSKTVTQELDSMLEKAKIGPELIESLGIGMRKMSENVSKMTDVTETATATNDFVKNIKDAGKSAGELSSSYKKASDVLQQDATTVNEFSANVKSAAASAGTLATVYGEVSTAFKNELSATNSFSNSITSASESANKLTARYNESSESLSKAIELLNFNALDSKAYNDQLQKISANMAALNTIYEVQVKKSNEQLETTNQLKSTVGNFLTSVNDSTANMAKYQQEIEQLTKRVSALNQVYGNMLTAMNVNLGK